MNEPLWSQILGFLLSEYAWILFMVICLSIVTPIRTYKPEDEKWRQRVVEDEARRSD